MKTQSQRQFESDDHLAERYTSCPMSKPIMTFIVAVAAAFLVLPGPAWAHHFMDGGLPATFVQGLLSGLAHPLIGLDHAAFIIASGFFLALIKRGMWGVLAMGGGSLFGAALHLTGVGLPGGEVGVAVSVILIGCLLLVRRQIKLYWLAGGLALAGMLHGYAYAEAIFGAEPAPLSAYLIGFSLMQLGIATAAFQLHRRLIAIRAAGTRPLSAGLGAAVGALGMVFLVSNFVN